MKKFAFVLLLGLMTLAFVGCGKEDKEENDDLRFRKSVQNVQTQGGDMGGLVDESNVGGADSAEDAKTEAEDAK